MSEYTSTLKGFQRAMEWSLNGPPEDARSYAEAMSTKDFCKDVSCLLVPNISVSRLLTLRTDHIMNGQRVTMEESIKHIAEWRGKISEYKPVV